MRAFLCIILISLIVSTVKLLDSLRETVTRALGLSGLTLRSHHRRSSWDRIGPHGIQPQTTLRKNVPVAPFRQDSGPAAFPQDLPGPTRYHSSLETLFPSTKVQAFDGDNIPYGERNRRFSCKMKGWLSAPRFPRHRRCATLQYSHPY